MASAIIAPLLSILAPAVGGLFTNRQPQTQTTNQNQQNSQQQNSFGESQNFGSSTPNLDPATLGFRDKLMQAFTSIMGADTDLSGYKSEGLKQIAKSTNAGVTNLNNFLSSRGINNTEGAGIGATNILNNGMDQANAFKSSLPQLALDNMLKKLQASSSFFSSIPYGTSTTNSNTNSGVVNSTGQQNSTSNTVGSRPDPLGGFITGAAAGASQYGQQQLQRDLASTYANAAAQTSRINNRLPAGVRQ